VPLQHACPAEPHVPLAHIPDTHTPLIAHCPPGQQSCPSEPHVDWHIPPMHMARPVHTFPGQQGWPFCPQPAGAMHIPP